VSRAISRQGVSTTYLNPFASDRFGRALAGQIQADGVRLAHPQPVAQATSLAVVSLNEQGHPDYAFYREGVADRQVSAEGLNADCAALPDLQCVCTGGLHSMRGMPRSTCPGWWRSAPRAGVWRWMPICALP